MTDQYKINHINKYWPKGYLFELMHDYLCLYEDDEKNKASDPESYEIWQDIKENCKTKKALLEKYLDVVWEAVCEEYSYA